MLRMSVHTHRCAPPPGIPAPTPARLHATTHTHTRTPAHAGGHGGRVLGHSPSLRPALAGNLVPSANTRASQGGLKWGQGMSRGCRRSPWAQARPCEDSTPQDYDPTPAPPQPEGPSCQDRRKWSPSITEGCQFPSPLNPPGPQNPAHLPARPQPTRNHLHAAVWSPRTEGGSSQGQGRPALAPSPSQPQRGGRGWGGVGASRSSPRPRCSLWLFIPM